MNEAETRAELIDPKLKACCWGLKVLKKALSVVNDEGVVTTGIIGLEGFVTYTMVRSFLQA